MQRQADLKLEEFGIHDDDSTLRCGRRAPRGCTPRRRRRHSAHATVRHLLVLERDAAHAPRDRRRAVGCSGRQVHGRRRRPRTRFAGMFQRRAAGGRAICARRRPRSRWRSEITREMPKATERPQRPLEPRAVDDQPGLSPRDSGQRRAPLGTTAPAPGRAARAPRLDHERIGHRRSMPLAGGRSAVPGCDHGGAAPELGGSGGEETALSVFARAAGASGARRSSTPAFARRRELLAAAASATARVVPVVVRRGKVRGGERRRRRPGEALPSGGLISAAGPAPPAARRATQDLPHDAFASAEAYVRENARRKAWDVAEQLRFTAAAAKAAEAAVIVAADTVVVLDGRILEKPASEDDAVRMLLALSGRTHQARGGRPAAALRRGGGAVVSLARGRSSRAWRWRAPAARASIWCCSTRRRGDIHAAGRGRARAYVATGEPWTAGAYGIRRGSVLVERVVGDYFNGGLPTEPAARELWLRWDEGRVGRGRVSRSGIAGLRGYPLLNDRVAAAATAP